MLKRLMMQRWNRNPLLIMIHSGMPLTELVFDQVSFYNEHNSAFSSETIWHCIGRLSQSPLDSVGGSHCPIRNVDLESDAVVINCEEGELDSERGYETEKRT